MACGNEAIASYSGPRAVLTPGLVEFLRELEMTKRLPHMASISHLPWAAAELSRRQLC